MDEPALISLAQGGDADALESLIRRYYPSIFAFCARRVGERGLAADLTQETFLRMTLALAGYREKGLFRSWLFTIAANLCRDAARRAPGPLPPLPPEPDSFTDGVERAMVLKSALHALPEAQQEAVILRYYHDFSQQQIARIQRVPVATVKTRLRRGLMRMRETLQKEGYFFEC